MHTIYTYMRFVTPCLASLQVTPTLPKGSNPQDLPKWRIGPPESSSGVPGVYPLAFIKSKSTAPCGLVDDRDTFSPSPQTFDFGTIRVIPHLENRRGLVDLQGAWNFAFHFGFWFIKGGPIKIPKATLGQISGHASYFGTLRARGFIHFQPLRRFHPCSNSENSDINQRNLARGSRFAVRRRPSSPPTPSPTP